MVAGWVLPAKLPVPNWPWSFSPNPVSVWHAVVASSTAASSATRKGATRAIRIPRVTRVVMVFTSNRPQSPPRPRRASWRCHRPTVNHAARRGTRGQTRGMATQLWGVVIAALDPGAQARWWADALGWRAAPEDDGDWSVTSDDPTVPELLFEGVTDAKTRVKNRMHLDLASASTEAQAATVARLRAAGATDADIGQHDTAWVVLADPEGNEFCVLDPRDRYQGAPGLAAIVLDANDPELLAGFWSAATGWPIARPRRVRRLAAPPR